MINVVCKGCNPRVWKLFKGKPYELISNCGICYNPPHRGELVAPDEILLSTDSYDASKDYSAAGLRDPYHLTISPNGRFSTGKTGINLSSEENGSYRVVREPHPYDINLILAYRLHKTYRAERKKK